MRYQAVIDPSNKNNSHSLTIDFIAEATGGEPLDILDVGCSAGYLGEYLRAKGHHVTGIDITAEAIAKAVEFLNEAYCLKVEDYLARNPERKFDVVIFGDVLEHVTNAEEVLRLTAHALKPLGRVVASIPNVGHLAVRAMLLEGRWEYANLGLLDRDHVRFFTRETIQKLFEDSGYDVNEMRSTSLPVETVDALCDMNLNPKFVAIAKNAAGGDASATIFQYVTMAQLKSSAPRIVCLVPDTSSGLFGFRVKAPLDNWARRHGGAVRYRLLGDQQPDDLLWGDVFLFERMGGAYTLHLIKVLKAHGKRVVFEIDDLLTELPDFLAHHRGSPETQQSLLDAITEADIITTTTLRLASQLKKINPNVFCVPNCIKDLPPERHAHLECTQSDTTPKATLIVASSDTVLVNFLIEPLLHIQQQYKQIGGIIKLIVVGPIDRALEQGGLTFERMPILSYADFSKLLQTLVNPIGLIPLDDSDFSACKSPIKYFDYSVAQIPSICSNVPPYADYIQQGITGILVDNITNAWVSAINNLIQSTEERRRLSNAARKYVIETHLADQAGDAWKVVIDQLNVKRVHIPGLVESSVLHIRPNINALWIIKKLIKWRTYTRALSILKSEGIAGVKKRLARW